MPIYEYECVVCGTKTERIGHLKKTISCTECGSPALLQVSGHAKTAKKWEVDAE